MDKIQHPDSEFDFEKLHLAQPVSIQGNAFFTKFIYKDSPFYIETPTASTKQGFVKSGKKMHVDLMFENTDTNFITWIENLEAKCCALLHGKSKEWFTENLELADIESTFTTPLKPYKSGKFYLLRTTTGNNTKIYNELDEVVGYDAVIENTSNISIIELLGIKFTNRNFQIEIELKQMQILQTEKIFEKCLISKNKKCESLANFKLFTGPEENINILDVDPAPPTITPPTITPTPFKQDPEPIDLENSSMELCEVDINSLTGTDMITLKKPNEVYYKIYKEAKQRAKKAKDDAIIAILEAKNIKQTYMLTDLSDDEEEDIDLNTLNV
jgi:hypothetical protein